METKESISHYYLQFNVVISMYAHAAIFNIYYLYFFFHIVYSLSYCMNDVFLDNIFNIQGSNNLTDPNIAFILVILQVYNVIFQAHNCYKANSIRGGIQLLHPRFRVYLAIIDR